MTLPLRLRQRCIPQSIKIPNAAPQVSMATSRSEASRVGTNN